MRALYLLILLVVSASAQDIQIHEVRDFSGGLVNSVANALTQDNQLVMMENYDVDPLGNLTRRPGLEIYITDTITDIIEGLLVYHGPGQKQLLVVRSYENLTNLDTAIRDGTSRLARCEGTPVKCTALIIDTLYASFRDTQNPNRPIIGKILNENLIIAGFNREPHIYNGKIAFPLSLNGPGQPRARVINGGGTLNGLYRYKICYTPGSGEKRSHPSAPTQHLRVHNGKVLLSAEPPHSRDGTDTTTWAIILRENIGVDTSYRVIDSFQIRPGGASDTFLFIDTNSANAGAYLPYEWGFHDSCFIYWPASHDYRLFDYTSTRGAGTADTLYREPYFDYTMLSGLGFDSFSHIEVSYFLTEVDSAGRESAPSAPMIYVESGGPGSRLKPDSFVIRLIGFDTLDTPRAVERRLYRHISIHGWPEVYLDELKYWYYVRDISDSITYFTDIWPLSNCTRICEQQTLIKQNGYSLINPGIVPENFCASDSMLLFRPSVIEMHGSRLYAAGNELSPNSIYFSDFGRPSCFPPDKFLYSQPTGNDWFTSLLSIGSDRLILGRQYSMTLLTGLSYYQYTVDKIVARIGTIAPATLVDYAGTAIFGGSDGLYDLAGAVEGRSLSESISASIDSVTNNLPFSFGVIINGEYWWSLPFGASDYINTKTYILSFSPKPHWKCYDFGIQDAVLFGFDTTISRIGQPAWVLLTHPNVLYRWGYDEDLNVDPSGGYSGRLKTKSFLEGPGRKKILWMEVLGSGVAQDWTLTFWDKLGIDSVGAKTYSKNLDSTVDARISVNEIVEDFAVSINDNGAGYEADTATMFGNKSTIGTYELLDSTVQFGHWDASYMSTWQSNNVPECTVNTIYFRVGGPSWDTGSFGNTSSSATGGNIICSTLQGHFDSSYMSSWSQPLPACNVSKVWVYIEGPPGGYPSGVVKFGIYDAGYATPNEYVLVGETPTLTTTAGSSAAWRSVDCDIDLTAGTYCLSILTDLASFGPKIYYTTKALGWQDISIDPPDVFPDTLGDGLQKTIQNLCMYAEWTEVSTAKVRLAVYDCDDADPDNWTVEGETQYRQLPDNYALGWSSVQCTLALSAGRKALAIVAYDGTPTDSIKVAYTTKASGPAIITTPSSGVFRDPLAFDSTPGVDSTRSWCLYAEFTRADTTLPDYKIHGIRFAWIPWDEGKKQ